MIANSSISYGPLAALDSLFSSGATSRASDEHQAADDPTFRDLLSRPNAAPSHGDVPIAPASACDCEPKPLERQDPPRDPSLDGEQPLIAAAPVQAEAPTTLEKDEATAPGDDIEDAEAEPVLAAASLVNSIAAPATELVAEAEGEAALPVVAPNQAEATNNHSTTIAAPVASPSEIVPAPGDTTEEFQVAEPVALENGAAAEEVGNDRRETLPPQDESPAAANLENATQVSAAEVALPVVAPPDDSLAKKVASVSSVKRAAQAESSPAIERVAQATKTTEAKSEIGDQVPLIPSPTAETPAEQTADRAAERASMTRKAKARADHARSNGGPEAASEDAAANPTLRSIDQNSQPLEITVSAEAIATASADPTNGIATRESASDALSANASPPPTTSAANEAAGGPRFKVHAASGAAESEAARPALTGAETTRFVHRVARAFQAAQQRDGELKLRLSPPELGSMRLELKLQEGAMTARLEVDNSATRAIVLDNLPALRERLAEQNVRVDQFEVHVGSGQQQSSSGQSFEDAPRERGFAAPQAPARRESEPRPAAPATVAWSSKDRLNVLV